MSALQAHFLLALISLDSCLVKHILHFRVSRILGATKSRRISRSPRLNGFPIIRAFILLWRNENLEGIRPTFFKMVLSYHFKTTRQIFCLAIRPDASETPFYENLLRVGRNCHRKSSAEIFLHGRKKRKDGERQRENEGENRFATHRKEYEFLQRIEIEMRHGREQFSRVTLARVKPHGIPNRLKYRQHP